MTEDFGEVLKGERLTRGLRFGALARLILDDDATPKQISRMAQRLVEVERSGRRDKRLVARLVQVLRLDPVLIGNILAAEQAHERERWYEWLNEPVDPVMHIRAIPGVWIAKSLAAVSADDALRIASEFAREKRVVVCVAVDRRLAVWFDRFGHEYARVATTDDAQPQLHSIIGGRPFVIESSK